ncbi:hypothetical protein BDW62DRAFT_196632 [Aspergillus aurantiobrunneus]
MPDPSRLPREFFVQILSDVVGGRPDEHGLPVLFHHGREKIETDLHEDTIDFSEDALAIAGLGDVGDPEADLYKGRHSPVIALILLQCRRSASLELHVARHDPYLDAVLARAVVRDWGGRTPPRKIPFECLRRLYTAKPPRRLLITVLRTPMSSLASHP